MNEVAKNKKKVRRTEHQEHKSGEHASAMSTRTASRAESSKMQIQEMEWDYEKVKEVVSAVYTIVSLFLTKEQRDRMEKVNTDVSAILGVNSISEWTPPQPLLNIVGLKAGGQSQKGGYREAA